MSDKSAVYIKINEGKEDGQIDFSLQTFRNGNLVDIEDADNSPVGIHGIYGFILVNALANDKGIQVYMEKLLTEFVDYLKEQREELGVKGEHGEK